VPTPNPSALEFLLTRRSRPAKTLTGPVPSHDEVMTILTAAARTPDHGKLEPWRFIVLEKAALQRLANLVTEIGSTTNVEPEKITKMHGQFAKADLAIAVISSPVDSPKVPLIEQQHSAGAVCLAMVNAALAMGWGANWLSGWASHDPDFIRQGLDCDANETVAGFIHLGTETNIPPERPRPDLSRITTWVKS